MSSASAASLMLMVAGLYVLWRGIDLAVLHPDPPATALTATRNSRRIIGVIAIAIGAVEIAFPLLNFLSE